jgi:hypothetical protein
LDHPDDHLLVILILMTIKSMTILTIKTLDQNSPPIYPTALERLPVNRPLMESLRPAQNYDDGQTR